MFACLLGAVLPGSALAATHARSTYPVITKVSPLKAGIGDRLTITGKNFRKGKSRNTVVFKRDGGRAIFAKVPKATSTRKLTVTIPAKLLPFLVRKKGQPQSTQFRLRVLAARFGKGYTSTRMSPKIGPRAISGAGTASDCDGDGVPNTTDTDDDNDLIPDTTEKAIGTDSCKRDTDGDGMSDGWEYYSSLDRNGKALPSPLARPYPNALDPKDGAVDSDGDGLSNAEEYAAWATFGGNKLPLNYSGGNPASAGRGAPPAGQAYMDRDHNGFLSDFERDADGDGIPNMDESRGNSSGSTSESGGPIFRLTPGSDTFTDFGVFTPGYLKAAEDATRDPARCAGINEVPFYCGADGEVQKVDTIDWLTADSDGDGVNDGQDDVDHDGVSNMDEYLREIGAAANDRHYGQLDACYPNTDAGYCLLGSLDVDGDGIPNRIDTDDDGDGLPDTLEKQYKLDPLKADTDGDGVPDGFEYWSALDLNGLAHPYPGKAPYPNPLDGGDANTDFDGDGLTLKQEYQAWNYSGRPMPLNYSDGTQYTGGKIKAAVGDVRDLNGNGYISDDEKDVDGDGLSNFDETTGRMRMAWWAATFGDSSNILAPPYSGYKETPYPFQDYVETSFVDPDTDGDGVPDGADDQDHDGYPNWFEVSRPANWSTTYTSTTFPYGTGTHNNPLARVNPFNPCKPIYSDACHAHPPFGYYDKNEDWASDTRPDSAWLPALPPQP
ncbi:MAG: IPT/TIG domain-containing protein [Solirubrobacteraceae bacterium]